MDTIEQKLGGIDNLPTLPMVLRQIQQIMNNPASNMGQIAAVVAKDQALASRTIRLVNSAYYARRNRVPSIRQAIVVLGLQTLYQLMIGLSVVKLFNDSRMLGFDTGLFWQHCFGVALIARKLGVQCGYSEPEECFTAGLLHDMGRLALQQFLHADFEIALREAALTNSSLTVAERASLGFDHCDAGEWLARRWKLPHALTTVLLGHHDPHGLPAQDAAHRRLVEIVSYANALCGHARIGDSGERCYGPLDAPTGLPPPDDRAVQATLEATRMEIISVVEEWTKS